MVELIANAASWQVFGAAAVATGFADPVTHAPITQGALGDNGSWFYNAAGQVVATPATYDHSAFPPTQLTPPVYAPGVWVRVRFNGDVPNLATLIAAWQSAGLTIYQLVMPAPPAVPFWSADGVTPAPDYVANIGVIA